MEIYERIRELRKDYLHLSMAAFGEKLGANRDMINNIENNRLKRPEQKASLYKLICKEFSVSEKWLLDGTGEMFITPEAFSIDKYMNDRGATALEVSIIKAYFDLDPETRNNLIEHFREYVLNDLSDDAAHATTPPDTVEDAEAAYIKSRSGNARKMAQSALNTTEDADSRKENAANE